MGRMQDHRARHFGNLGQGFILRRTHTAEGVIAYHHPHWPLAWAPLIGPSSVVLAQSLRAIESGTELTIDDLGPLIGQKPSQIRPGKVIETVDRLCGFVPGWRTGTHELIMPSAAPYPHGKARHRWSTLIAHTIGPIDGDKLTKG